MEEVKKKCPPLFPLALDLPPVCSLTKLNWKPKGRELRNAVLVGQPPGRRMVGSGSM